MCLVFIAYRLDDATPIRIGANREESRRRPMTSPVCCQVGVSRCLLAGADHGPDGSFAAMGTWLGLNESGLAVAVTNRSDGALAWEDQTRSRGLLAVALLGFDRAEAAARFARSELATGGFGGCNYLVAGRDSACVIQAPGAGRVAVIELPPGIHAMTNLDIDDRGDPRIRYVKDQLDPADFLASAGRICRDDRIIIAGADRGTIASSLIQIGAGIGLHHIRGDPRGREYEQFRLR